MMALVRALVESGSFYYFVMLFTAGYGLTFTFFLISRYHYSETARRFVAFVLTVVLWSVKDAVSEMLLPVLADRPDRYLRALALISPLFLVVALSGHLLLVSVYNATVEPGRRFRHTTQSAWAVCLVLLAVYAAALIDPHVLYRTFEIAGLVYRYTPGPGLLVFGALLALSVGLPVAMVLRESWRRRRSQAFLVALGFVLALTAAVLTNLVPRLWGAPEAPRLGCLSMAALCAVAFYGITRYGTVFSLTQVLAEREKLRLIADGMDGVVGAAEESALFQRICDGARVVSESLLAAVVFYLEGERTYEVRAVSVRDGSVERLAEAGLPLAPRTVYELDRLDFLKRHRSAAAMVETRSVAELLGPGRTHALPGALGQARQVLVYPVMHEGAPRGALILVRERRDPCPEALRVFALQCSLVLRFTWQIAELEKVRRLEEQLHRAHRMEAVGQLAGGIAHDFNNTLSGVTGYAQLIKRKYGEGAPELASFADAIITAARRSADLTEKLLAFARKGTLQPVALDLHQVLSDALEILRPTLDKRILIETAFRARPSMVHGDPVALQNVLINLAINARHAMPGGGTLRIMTDTVTLDTARLVDNEYEIRPGSYVVLAVADTGVGMDRDTRRRVFEPFFTTDTTGTGTGLGLSMVYGTVKSHKGFISVESEPGRGATFTIHLPLLQAAAPDIQPRRKTEQIVLGQGHVLVVDDDETICQLAHEMLAFLGYTSVTVRSGAEAIAYLREHTDDVDVALIDIMMPHMDGYETFHQLRKLRPDLRAVFTTGFALPRDTRYMAVLGVSGFLQKPFDSSRLSQVLHDTLHGSGQSALRAGLSGPSQSGQSPPEAPAESAPPSPPPSA